MRAHGTAVGLPTEDDMGNSEVGHNALGAGRIFAQGSVVLIASFSGFCSLVVVSSYVIIDCNLIVLFVFE